MNFLSTYFAALTIYKVSTYLKKVFLNYPISSALLKHLQSRLPGRDQEEKNPKTLKLEIPILCYATLSTYFKFWLSKKNKIKLKLYFLV